MSTFIQEVLGLLNRNQKKTTLDKTKDWFEFGKLYQTSSLNNKSGYTPKMDPFVIKWGDFICQATEDMTRTLPGQGNLGYIPVYTDPSGSCNWDTLKDSIITQNELNTIINVSGSLQVLADVQISGGDLTATTATFNLLNSAPVSIINFGSTTTNIEVGGAATVVNINGTAESTNCTTGALVVDGGVGIAKNLNVCGELSVAGATFLNGNVSLGNNISDIVRLYGTLYDNAGNGPLVNQVLVGQGGGQAFWQNDDVTEALTYGSIWRGNSSNLKEQLSIGASGTVLISDGTTLNWTPAPWITSFNVAGNIGTGLLSITEGNTLSILGGTGISTSTTATDTVTINHLDYGTAGTYTYPSSITTNAQGHITAITSGTAGGSVTANNGLTMSTATNVQLGGTLAQGTIIQTQTFDLKLEGTGVIPILNVNQLSTNIATAAIKGASAGGYAGYFEATGAALGALYASHSGGGIAAKFERFGSNNTGIATILDLYNTCNTGPGAVGLGAGINFNIEDGSSVSVSAGSMAYAWTSVSGGNTSRFIVTTNLAGTIANKLEVAGSGQLKLNNYGVNTFTGAPTYLLATTSTGNIIETAIPSAGMTSFSVFGDSGTPDTITNGQQLSINGGVGLTSVATSGSGVSIDLDDTTVIPGSYGVNSNIALEIDAQGRITSAVDGPTEPMKLIFLVTQIVAGDVPTLITLRNDYSGVTFSCNYISSGVYSLQASVPTFVVNKTAVFITPDVNFEVPYCAAIERTSDTLLTFASYNMAGVFQDSKFQLATIKVEIFS
jgi:hypothetical protein